VNKADSSVGAVSRRTMTKTVMHREDGPRSWYGRAMIDVSPEAEHNPLTPLIVDRIRANLEREDLSRDFARLRACVVMADDAGNLLTLSFDFGRLFVHDGIFGVPDLTVQGRPADLVQLMTRALPTQASLRELFSRDAFHRMRELVGALRSRRLRVYGLTFRPRLALRILRLLARPAPKVAPGRVPNTGGQECGVHAARSAPDAERSTQCEQGRTR
jgi:hypothetical protein